MANPQMKLRSAHPVDWVGQYLNYVKYCSTQSGLPAVDSYAPGNLNERPPTTTSLEAHLLVGSYHYPVDGGEGILSPRLPTGRELLEDPM